MVETRQQQILAVAWHEAGHALMANILNISKVTATLWMEGGTPRGQTTFDDYDSRDTALVAAAGVVAGGLYLTRILGKSNLMTDFTNSSVTNYEGGDFWQYRQKKLTRHLHWVEATEICERHLKRDLNMARLERISADLVRLGTIEIGAAAKNHEQQRWWLYGLK